MKYVIPIMVLCLSLVPLQGMSKDDGQNKLEALSGILAKSQSEKDLKKLIKKANKGNADAQYALAKKYEEGSEIPQDLSAAKAWYGVAAKQGHVKAKEALLNFENPSAQSAAVPSEKSNGPAQKVSVTANNQQKIDDASRFQVNPDDPLMKQGMWKDPKTGLIWTRCLIGKSWSGTKCEGKVQVFGGYGDVYVRHWIPAILAADDFNYGGHDDWRLPSIDELADLINCDESNGFSSRFNPTAYPGDDGVTKHIYGSCNKPGTPVLGSRIIFPDYYCTSTNHLITSSSDLEKTWYVSVNSGGADVGTERSVSNTVCVLAVRGGKIPSFYPQKVAQAQQIKNELIKKSASENAEAEKKAAQLEVQKKALQEERNKKIAALSQRSGARDVNVSIGATNRAASEFAFTLQASADQATIWKVAVNRGNCALDPLTAARINQGIKLRFGQTYTGYAMCKVDNVLEIEIVTENGKFVLGY